MYKLLNDNDGNLNTIEKTIDEQNKLYIPINPANTSYQEYLEWVADGGVPEPADTPEEAE